MQLRTNRKLKSTELDDLGFEEKPIKTHKKSYKAKIAVDKDHSDDDVSNIHYFYFIYIFQNSNISKKNDTKTHRALRNQVSNYIYLFYF